MITKEMEDIDKCCIYVNDFHLEMILLPYIKENLNKTRFIILTENNLEDTVKILLERINLDEKYKKQIYNLNWNCNNEEKIKEIEKLVKELENITIIIKGSLDYIKKISNKINEIKNKNVSLIKCFYTEDINERLDFRGMDVLNTKKII